MKNTFKWGWRALAVGGLSYGIYNHFMLKAQTETEFFYQQTETNEKILQLCREHLQSYRPSFFLVPHGALQQLWHIYFASDRHTKVTYERDVIRMPDGGQIAMDWAYPKETRQELTKVCFVFPGLSGSSDRHYIKSLVRHLTEDRGYIVGVFHNRGVTLEYTSPELADLSSSEEIEAAIAHMQDKFKSHPNPVYVAVGMSMGANLMLRVAGEQGTRWPFDAMVSFNNPFDIMLSINLMRNTPYEKYLARELRKNVLIRDNASEREREIFRQMETKFNISFEDLKNTESWGEFDNKFTLKVRSQFKTVADYYHAASCLFRIKEIAKPTLVIHSRDDPIIPIDCLPTRECSSNPNIIVGVVNCGGHVCYFQGSDGQQRWYPLVSSEYLDAIIELKQSKVII